MSLVTRKPRLDEFASDGQRMVGLKMKFPRYSVENS
jgi:hypothetical protein